MILFSSLYDVGETVPIEDHVWNALGLGAGLKYHLTLPGHRDNTIANELLCAPVPSRNWKDLWHLRVAFHDRPGLLADLTDLLEKADVDILSCRAETTEPHGIVNVEMHIDSYRYARAGSIGVGTTETGGGPTLPAIRAHIIAQFIEELIFTDQQPLLSLWRVLPLYMSVERIEMEKEVRLGERALPVPKEFFEKIRVASNYDRVRSDSGLLPKAAVRADTEAGILRLMILFPGTGHMSLRIRGSSELGTLAKISNFMRDSDFNMLQIGTVKTGNGHEAVSDVILHVPNHRVRFETESDMPELVREKIEKGVDRVTSCELIWPGI